MPDGFLLVDKPASWTSHDVVAGVRRLYGLRKVGHAGTLDPMATGLLALALGRATRLLRFLQDREKEYLAEAQFGVATTTLDADGEVLWREPMPVSGADVAAVLPRFTGRILQVPPMVSALKIEGRRLYELAREGAEVEREARPVDVHLLELVDFGPSEYPTAELRVVCGKGTYIRTLADDIARALGGHAHLSALRRLRIGSLHVDDAATIEELEGLDEAGRCARVLDPATGLGDLPAVSPDPATAQRVAHGAAFPFVGPPGPIRVLDGEGGLLAVYRSEGRHAVPEVVLS